MIYPNIRIEMERGGYTVHQLAAILGLPLSALVYKLHGKCEFTLYESECLADLFDCSLDYLVGHRRKGVKQVRYGGMITMEPFIRQKERGIP